MAKDFKIVLPGGCNAACTFCFKEAGVRKDPSPIDWVYAFSRTLDQATPEFHQLNITGGEPTMSPVFDLAMKTIVGFRSLGKFDKVVLTSNGFNIKPIDLFGAVDHLNISRHHYDDKVNMEIFRSPSIPTTEKLRNIIEKCNKIGIDVSLSLVLTDKMQTRQDILNMVKYCKNVGARALRIRQDYAMGLTPILLQQYFNQGRQVIDRCPVCMVVSQQIEGLDVSWHSGVLEPSEIITDSVYELVFQPEGRLTLDYAGKKQYSFPIEAVRAPKAAVVSAVSKVQDVGCHMLGSCGSTSGCGVTRSYTGGCGSTSGCGYTGGCG